MQNLIDEKSLAKILGKALQTLRNDRFKKTGVPYLKLGGSVRYRMDDVEDYIEKSRITFDD